MKMGLCVLIVLLFVLYPLSYVNARNAVIPQAQALAPAAPTVTSCLITVSPWGPKVSVVGDADGSGDRLGWLEWNGGVTTNLKFTLKFNPTSPITKHIQKLEDVSGSITTPFSFPWWFGNPSHGPATLIVKDDAGRCTYPIELVDNGWESTDVPKGFGAVTPVDSTITTSDIGTISSVIISVQINHTYDGDVGITLIGPDATTVVLASSLGGASDNYGVGFNHSQRTVFSDAAATSITTASAPFTGSFQPQNALTPFVGKTGAGANGVWTLRVSDVVPAFDNGTLVNWALIINDNEF